MLTPSFFSLAGCVAAVGSRDGFIYSASFGNFTYGDPAPISHSNPPMTNEVSASAVAATAFFA